MITLRCISLIEPYASLVVGGVKTIETRTGPVLSRTRGPLLIAVSKKPEAALDRWAPPKPSPPAGWPGEIRGHVIGVVNVTGIWKPISDSHWSQDGETPDIDHMDELRRRACFGEVGGRWLAFLDRAEWLTEPVPVRGYPGTYPVTLDAELLPAWTHLGGQGE